MATRLLDNGEAYMSAADKGFARVADLPVHIGREEEFSLSPNLISIGLAIVIFALAVFAFSL